MFRERNDCRKCLTLLLSEVFGDAWECHNTVEEKGGCQKFGHHVVSCDDDRMEWFEMEDSEGVSLVYVPA